MQDYAAIDRYLESKLDSSIAELSRYAAQPSVAAQNVGMTECAEMTAAMLRARGFAVEMSSAGGPPVVYGVRKGRADRTLLFYNHYDVQPAEPLELWHTPPFEPTIRDGKLFARGVSDDKGHLVARLHAIDAILATDGDLPCNVKFVVEGEEEVSSVHLGDFVRANHEKLAADVCVWEFGSVDHEDVPRQYLGLRGICYVELSVECLSQDVHSGVGGSIFPNAAWRLVWALATLKGPDEKIRVAGHYDDVKAASTRDMELLEALPDQAGEYRSRYGVKSFVGGVTGGAELARQEVFEPTCTICGITTGYQGEGAKTVLPARASAKVDFRLVPDQTPEQTLRNLRAHLDAHGFADVKIDFLGGESPGRTDPDDPFVKLVVETAEPVYGVPMRVVPLIGGSGPNHVFLKELKVPIVSAGLGYPGTQAHAPNENVRLDLYLKHAKHVARILKEYAAG